MVLVVTMTTTLAVLAMAMFTAVIDTSKWTSHELDDYRVAVAADSATTLAANRIWSQFETFMAGDAPNIAEYWAFMDSLGIPNQALVADPNVTDYRVLAGLAVNNQGAYAVGDVQIDLLGVHRVDRQMSSHLIITATATARDGTEGGPSREYSETVRQVFVIEPPDWEGLNFALLTNNINCLMCHMEVDRATRFYNTDEENYNESRRVKMASIESFHLREDPESWIAGTLYLGGDALGDDGSQISNWLGMNLKSREFDSSGFLVEDNWGNLTPTDLVPGDADDPAPLENLYGDYFSYEDPPDGFVPGEFPSPFAETDPALAGNRVVDPAEFLAAVANSSGTISGGSIGLSPLGQTVTDDDELEDLIDGTEAMLDPITMGNVYLYGTEDDPIILNGDVAIDGDLIISGVVKGKGTVKVSGNVYVPSDLVYADGENDDDSRTYGVAEDGTTNTLTLASAGNIMVGDFYHPAWGVGDPANGYTTGSFNFLMEEMVIFNRMEWMKTQPTLPGEPTWMLVGSHPEDILDWQIVGNHLVDDWDWVVTGTEMVDLYEKVVVGTKMVDDYDEVVTGTKMVDVYGWVVVEERPEEYGGDILEWGVVGQEEKDIKEKVLVGQKEKDIKEKVLVGQYEKDIKEWQVVGNHLEDDWDWVVTGVNIVDDWEEVRPQLVNPYYEGAGFVPRYYAFNDQGSPVAVFNKTGWFDGTIWVDTERAGGWDANKLTYADPLDPTDPLLYDGLGDPIAAISTVAPSQGWISDDLMRGMILGQQALRDDSLPLELDGTFYSNNSIYGIIPNRRAPGMNGKLLINGALVAADVGLLAPLGTQLNYDPSGSKLIKIRSNTRLAMRRQLWAPSQLLDN